jgi:hypothetical protein
LSRLDHHQAEIEIWSQWAITRPGIYAASGLRSSTETLPRIKFLAAPLTASPRVLSAEILVIIVGRRGDLFEVLGSTSSAGDRVANAEQPTGD